MLFTVIKHFTSEVFRYHMLNYNIQILVSLYRNCSCQEVGNYVFKEKKQNVLYLKFRVWFVVYVHIEKSGQELRISLVYLILRNLQEL